MRFDWDRIASSTFWSGGGLFWVACFRDILFGLAHGVLGAMISDWMISRGSFAFRMISCPRGWMEFLIG